MADQAAAKLFNFKTVKDFGGYVSSVDKTKLATNFYVQGSQNVYKKISGNLAVRQGQKRRGAADATHSPISSEFVWNTSWGATYTMFVSDNKMNVDIDSVVYALQTGLTATRYVFDKWWDDSQQQDIALFVHGSSNIEKWNGGVATISTSGSVSITKTGTTSWEQEHFDASNKTIIINGATYTYTGGGTTTTITGVSPDATGVTGIALQAVESFSNTPAAGFHNDFIKTVNNQVYVGSYTSRLCYISANDDFTDYVVPTPRTSGSAELLTLDSTLKGITIKSGNAFIGYGTSEWASVVFNDITVGTDLTQQTVVTPTPVAKNAAPLAHEFISNSGDNIVYLAQDHQVRVVGNFNDLFVQGFPSLSQDINTELSLEDFDNGALKCIGDFTYLTAPNSGKVYLNQVRQLVDNDGRVVAERLWHSPFIWNATRIDDIDGVVHAFSNSNPQIYEIWDTGQWYDDSPNTAEYITNGDFNGNATGWNLTGFAYNSNNIRSVSSISGLGSIVSYSIAAVGSGYTLNDILIISGGTNGTFQVGSIDGSGGVTSINVIDAGTGYSIGVSGSTGGTGTGFTLDIQAIQYSNIVSQDVSLSQSETYILSVNITRVDANSGQLQFLINDSLESFEVNPVSGTYTFIFNPLVDGNQTIKLEWIVLDDSITDVSVVDIDDISIGTGEGTEQLPYTCTLAFSYWNGGTRENLISFEKLFTEGYLTPGTPLNLLINYDYQGSTGQAVAIVNNINQPARTFGTASASLGDSIIGEKILGDELMNSNGDSNDLLKFRCINSLSLTNCFEYQPIYSSDAVNAQWEILATGSNLKLVSEQDAAFIINKKQL